MGFGAIGNMTKGVYDPDEDGLIALAQLVAAVCSETEAISFVTAEETARIVDVDAEEAARIAAITAHTGVAGAHHTKFTNTEHDVVARHPLANLDDLVCSEAEADSKITTHGTGSKHRWTLDKLLKGAGAGADPTEIDTPSSYPSPVTTKVSAVNMHSNGAERQTNNTSYTKLKEILLTCEIPRARLKYDIKTVADTGLIYGKSYKNGVPMGTELPHSGTSWTTKSEDFTGWVAGDLIQIYAYHASGASSVVIRNEDIYYDLILIDQTNQDP